MNGEKASTIHQGVREDLYMTIGVNLGYSVDIKVGFAVEIDCYSRLQTFPCSMLKQCPDVSVRNCIFHQKKLSNMLYSCVKLNPRRSS